MSERDMNKTTKDQVLNVCKKNVDKLTGVLDSHEERGILHSEMLAICSVCDALGVDVIIESGRARGQSTIILARFFADKDVRLISIEFKRDSDALYAEEKLKPYKNMELLYGDSCVLIPKLAKDSRGKRIAILLDGPKGKVAVDLFQAGLGVSENIVVGFFHDTAKRTLSRNLLATHFRQIFFTDDEDYVEAFKFLDTACLPKDSQIVTIHIWRPYMKGERAVRSYGPTLAVVFPSRKEGMGKLATILLLSKWRLRAVLRPLKKKWSSIKR